MPIIEFKEKDLLRGKVVTSDWYRVRIDSIGQKPSSDGGSINYPVESTIIKNATNGATDFQGVPIDWNFNSKAIGFAVGFFEAFGVTAEAGKRYDFDACVGQELDVFVENDLYQGRVVNKVNHKYRKAS